jgi:outer membrane protein assembly factor BamA
MTALGSDLAYTRQFAQAHYVFEQHHSKVRADVIFGRLTGGPAPLFERFSLGDSQTLRGWDKYIFAPIGGNRVWHQSIEYSYRGFGYFLDAGSVWDQGSDARVRVSTGVGYGRDNLFMTFAVPLNADDMGAKFMAGFRFGGFGLAWR